MRDVEDFDVYRKRVSIERDERWDTWTERLPSLHFPAGWGVKVLPPFGGALVRFVVTNVHGAKCSVYFDAHGRLGAVDAPYWEMHCVDGKLAYDEETPLRYLMGEEDRMLRDIALMGDPAHNMRQALLKGD